MISQLRKRHHRAWSVLGIVIPLAIIYVGTISYAPQVLDTSAIASTELVSNSGNLQVVLNNQSLEVRVLKPLRSPWSEVFAMYGESCSTQHFIGTLESTGTYNFKIPKDGPCKIIVIDGLNETIVESVQITK